MTRAKFLFQLLTRILVRLDLKPGEERKTFLLACTYLISGVFFACYPVLALAGFLTHVGAEALPLAYILTAISMYAVSRSYSALLARFQLPLLLPRVILVLLLFLTALSVSAMVTHHQALSPVGLSWLLFLSFYPLMSLFDHFCAGMSTLLFPDRSTIMATRGRALEKLAGITCLAVLALKLPATWLVINHLLIIATAASVLAAICCLLLRPHFVSTPLLTAPEETWWKAEEKDTTRYYQMVFLLTLCTTFSYYLADFVWLASTLTRYPTIGAQVRFLALFLGGVRLLELIMSRFISAFAIRRFGQLAGVKLLPAVLFLPYFMAFIFAYSLGSHNGMFFLSFCFARGLDQAIRHTLYDRSLPLVFEPFSKQLATAMKNRLSGPSRLLALFFVSSSLFLMLYSQWPLHFMILLVPAVLGLSFVISLNLQKRYSRLIRQVFDRETVALLIESPLQVLSRELAGATSNEIGFALNVLEHVAPDLLEDYLKILLVHQDPLVRLMALERIDTLQLQSLAGHVTEISQQDPDVSVCAMAGFLADALTNTEEQLSTTHLNELGSSKFPSDRLHAARLATDRPPQEAIQLLNKLLWDRDISVRRHAMISAGKMGLPEFWPILIDHLSHGMYYKAAASALIAVGEPILDTELNSQSFRSQEAQIRIMKVQEHIGGPRATQLLFSMISDANRRVRRQALHSLTYLGYRASKEQEPLIKALVEHCVDQISWNLAAQRDLAGLPEMRRLLAALVEENKQSYSLLLMLLALIYDRQAVKMIQNHMTRNDSSNVFALEVAREVLPADLKSLILPLIELLPPAKTLQRLHHFCPRPVMSPLRHLEDIIGQGPGLVNPWTRILAVDVFGKRKLIKLDALAGLLFSAQPLERQAAALVLRHQNETYYRQLLARLDDDSARELTRVLPPEGGQQALLHLEKVPLLRNTDLFQDIPDAILAGMALKVAECNLTNEEILFCKGDKGDALFLVVDGTVRIHNKEKVFVRLSAGAMLGEIAVVETGERTLDATAEGDTRLLRLDRDSLFDIMADYLEVIPPITRVIAQRRARG